MFGDVLRSSLVLEAVGNAEVRQLDDALGVDHDVLRLDVAVDDAVVIPGGVKRRGDRFADQEAVRLLDVLLAAEEIGEGIAVDELHDVEPLAVRIAAIVGLDDAGMVDFLHEALFGAERADFDAV